MTSPFIRKELMAMPDPRETPEEKSTAIEKATREEELNFSSLIPNMMFLTKKVLCPA